MSTQLTSLQPSSLDSILQIGLLIHSCLSFDAYNYPLPAGIKEVPSLHATHFIYISLKLLHESKLVYIYILNVSHIYIYIYICIYLYVCVCVCVWVGVGGCVTCSAILVLLLGLCVTFKIFCIV